MMDADPEDRPKILIVDDEPINIRILYQLFNEDYQVFMATSGAQALSVCRDQRPDLVLLDVVMPTLDGFEVCRQLKSDEATSDIPVIFVTAHDDAIAETRGLDAGAVDFISKPIVPKVVRARVRTHLTLKRQADQLRRFALRDGLTGLFNRRYFDERLTTEWRRARRNGTPLSLVMIDVDCFKAYNDGYGHLAGDDCLRTVSEAISGAARRGGDVAARYGGEEFACILPETPASGAATLAERIVQKVRGLGLPHAGSPFGLVTISAGVASKTPRSGGSEGQLLKLADEQLYRAKAGGRSRMEQAELSEPITAAAPPTLSQRPAS